MTAENPVHHFDIPAARLPVGYEADVVVVGAGPGGFAAALQAARMGASVIVVEKFDMPGGVHTSGLQGSADGEVGGIHAELIDRLHAEGYIYTATEESHPDWAGNPLTHYERFKQPGSAFSRVTFNPEGAGCVMSEMLQEAGARVLYDTRFVDCVMRDGPGDSSIEAIVVQNPSGRFAIRGKVFIEGSGTAEVAARAAAGAEVRDASGNLLADGDAVVLVKDLKVKGAGQTLKQGTVIRSIRLTDNPQEIDCRHETIKGLVLRTEFVRKR